MARNKADIPFTITSGKRSSDINEQAGGVQDSSHISGKAVDLACADSPDRFKMVSALLAVGFRRIGIYEKHCHVDVDETKPQDVAWIGTSH